VREHRGGAPGNAAAADRGPRSSAASRIVVALQALRRSSEHDAVFHTGRLDSCMLGACPPSLEMTDMALVPCAECRREISTRALACPACGCPGADTEGARSAAHSANPLRNAGLLGKLAYVVGAWAMAPHIERTIGIVAFCILAGVASYFLFSGGRC
jgi:hypothetical protein